MKMEGRSSGRTERPTHGTRRTNVSTDIIRGHPLSTYPQGEGWGPNAYTLYINYHFPDKKGWGWGSDNCQF